MDIMDGVNVVMAIMGLGELCLGSHVLVTGKVPGGRVTEPGQIRKYGVALILFSGFFLLQVIGYLGVRLGLWSSVIRGLLLLLAVAVAAITMVKSRPLFSLTMFRRHPERNSIDPHG
ncbi:hypothetical protein [Dactylosporangium sp. CA-092794]|uniref:hypothetical protein n=1 Tax=Dactylosporangium sp. CA-092794 TaxID=3239929 RepID=UPI003D8AF081